MTDLEVGTILYDRYNFEHEIRSVVDSVGDVTVYAVRFDSPKSPGQWAYEIVYSFAIEMGLYTLEPCEEPLRWGL